MLDGITMHSGYCLVCLLLLSWTTAAQAKELRPATMTPVVLSGMRSRIARFDQVQPDCTAVELPVVLVTKKPANGQIEVEEEMGFSLYPNSVPQYKCNDQRTLGAAVFYTSSSGFKGTDRFEIEVFYTLYASTRKVRFTTTVK